MPGKASGDEGSAKTRQAAGNPSSVQQQFAFAAGLAAADDLPLATPDETVQLRQVSSATESQQPPAQQEQLQRPESGGNLNKQSAFQSDSQPKQSSGDQTQQEQLNPGVDPDQQTGSIQQRDDRADPQQRDQSEAQLGSSPSTSASSASSRAGSSSNGSSSSSDFAVGEDSSADAEVVEIEQMSFGERIQAGLDCFR